MLLCHQFRFIFIKTRKTAGSSIEVDLGKVMGPDDIVTPIKPPVEGHQPRNYSNPNLLRRLRGRDFRNHMAAANVKRYLPAEVWDSYHKFCVEREPVSKCISKYSMLQNSPDFGKDAKGMSWDEWVERGEFPMDAHIYLDENGQLLVDQVMKFENLNEELTAFARERGFPFEGLKARAKSGWRMTIEPTAKQKQIIYDAFAPTLPFTGYSL